MQFEGYSGLGLKIKIDSYSFVMKCIYSIHLRSLGFLLYDLIKYTGINWRARNGRIHSKYITTSYRCLYRSDLTSTIRSLRSNLGMRTQMRITRPFNKDEITADTACEGMVYQKNFR